MTHRAARHNHNCTHDERGRVNENREGETHLCIKLKNRCKRLMCLKKTKEIVSIIALFFLFGGGGGGGGWNNQLVLSYVVELVN